MPVSVVVGGQFGSEGKGKVAHILAKRMNAAAVVRVGGSNSGHTVVDSLGTHVFRQLPTAALLPRVHCIIPPGAYIDPELILSEIKQYRVSSELMAIDPAATLITKEDRDYERSIGLRDKIGSTLSGTGSAVRRRIDRRFETRFAAHESALRAYIRPTGPLLRELLNQGCRVIVEGTQGYGLSVLHGVDYPHVTSRDTTAANFIAEAGLSPLDVDDIVMVLRAYPIRVAGNSGKLANETTWDDVTRRSGGTRRILEHTTVTGVVRRVGLFDAEVVRRAIETNQPTRIVLNHLDYLDSDVASRGALTDKASRFAENVSVQIAHQIDFYGISPSVLIHASQCSGVSQAQVQHDSLL